jgi:hypothetical protein
MSDGDADHAVCRVRSAAHPDQLIVTWWISREVSLSRELPPPPPVSIESYSNVLKCKLAEVFELCSLSTTINACSVKDLAFVFHIDTLEHELPNCAGMSRTFYTRYRYDHLDRLLKVDCHLHYPFSNMVLESFPSCIWQSILDVKEKVEKLMNDPKQYQPCRKMLLMKFSLECWNYFYMAMMNSGAVVVQLRRNHTKTYMLCDLTLSSHRVKQNLTLVRIDYLPAWLVHAGFLVSHLE